MVIVLEVGPVVTVPVNACLRCRYSSCRDDAVFGRPPARDSKRTHRLTEIEMIKYIIAMMNGVPETFPGGLLLKHLDWC